MRFLGIFIPFLFQVSPFSVPLFPLHPQFYLFFIRDFVPPYHEKSIHARYHGKHRSWWVWAELPFPFHPLPSHHDFNILHNIYPCINLERDCPTSPSMLSCWETAIPLSTSSATCKYTFASVSVTFKGEFTLLTWSFYIVKRSIKYPSVSA